MSTITPFILQAKKCLKRDWLRQVVFKPNLKYLHVKITPAWVSMVTEKWLFLILKQWRTGFPIVTQKNCNSLRKMPKIRTKKNTKTCLTVWTTWAEEKGHSPDIVSYEAKELDEKLQRLFAEVRKKDDSDYEPDSLRLMIASLDRHLKETGSNISIAEDKEFVNSRKVLEGKSSLPPWTGL